MRATYSLSDEDDIAPEVDGDSKIIDTHMDENDATDENACNHYEKYEELGCLRFESIQLIVYGLYVLKGIIYPLFKVTSVALTSKLLKEVLRVSLDHEFFMQVEKEVFGSIRTSRITSIYLMESLDFNQTLVAASALVFVLSITYPFGIGLNTSYLNYMEVKRLQRILYDKFMMEPNSVELQEARDLVYTKIASMENYWSDHKYCIADNVTSIIFSLFLFLVLAWDLGLIYCGATTIIVFVAKFCWSNLSSPWSERREQKMSETNERLLDLVTCKDSVLSHTMELRERSILWGAISSDKKEIHNLLRATIVAECVKIATFTMLVPMISLYIYMVDLTMERVFQFLITLVVTEEGMRSYLSYLSHQPHVEENERDKDAFAGVLGMDRDELFPPGIPWRSCFQRKEVFDIAGEGHSPMECGIAEHLATGSGTSYTEKKLSLNLENISLGYPKRNESAYIVVENLNLSFPIGSHTAIMGESGLGKTTIFKAIAGLIPVLKGTISFHGERIDATCRHWRKQVAVVNQDSVLFNRTLRENLTYGLSNVNDEDIFQVLEKVRLREMVMALPRKLDTIVRNNGNEFSGGERQRIQIARLLLSTCSVILLDEMTSALDPKTALDIVDYLKDFVQGKTLIMVTHNIQTLPLVENVFQMQKGGLVSDRQASALMRDVTSDQKH